MELSSPNYDDFGFVDLVCVWHSHGNIIIYGENFTSFCLVYSYSLSCLLLTLISNIIMFVLPRNKMFNKCNLHWFKEIFLRGYRT